MSTLTAPTPPSQTGSGIEAPPRTFGGTLLRIGPGLILAGAVVGSGELIATTKVGAEAGFWLLWLVILGCVLKVFAQVEIGRYALTWGKTSMEALNELPGPRWRVHWVLWYWFAVILLIISQNGGIVGGVGQALAIAQPLTEEGTRYNQLNDDLVRARVDLAIAEQDASAAASVSALQARIGGLNDRVAATPPPADPAYWAVIVAVATAVIMYFGRYGFIQLFSTVLVGGFTIVTVAAVFMLQETDWAVRWSEIADGLSFRLPPAGSGSGNGLTTALAAFGMIGLSAGELITYPYWCLEKGYGRFTGQRDATPEWAERARGWLRVMRFDVMLCLLIYTFATLAFYILGAAILEPSGLSPEGEGMIRTLAELYVPVFGSWAQGFFLFGAFAILYSSYFVFAAAFARLIVDAFVLLGLLPDDAALRDRWTRWTAVALPLIAVVLYLCVRAPVTMVLAAGLGQSTMMPLLGGAALYFRYRRSDERLRPGLLWDVFLWLSCVGLFIIGAWSLYNAVTWE